MGTKRIINMNATTDFESDDNIVVDSTTAGTRKMAQSVLKEKLRDSTLSDIHNLTPATDFASGDTIVVDNATDGPRGMDKDVLLAKTAQNALGSIKNLPTSITAFRTGDYIVVDGPSGTAKMGKDDLLKETADNALGGIHSLSNTAEERDVNGNNYFVLDTPTGPKKLAGTRLPFKIAYTLRTGGYWGTDGTYHTDPTKNYKNTLLMPCTEGDVFTYQGYGAGPIASVLFFNGNTFVSAATYDAIDSPEDVTIPSGVNVVRFGSTAASPATPFLVVAKKTY